MKVTISLTQAEAKSLIQRDRKYSVVEGTPVWRDEGTTLNWPHGVRKTKARCAAEIKVLQALVPPPADGPPGMQL